MLSTIIKDSEQHNSSEYDLDKTVGASSSTNISRTMDAKSTFIKDEEQQSPSKYREEEIDESQVVEEGVAVAIGIDLGRTYSRVGIWQRANSRIEILPLAQGKRSTPTCVAFTDTGILIGEGARNQAAWNPANTIYDLRRLVGRRFSDASFQIEMKLWPFKVVRGPNDVPMIIVSYAFEEKIFSAVEILAIFLKHLKDVARGYLSRNVQDAVIAVPAYFCYSQHQAIIEACQIAGLNALQIISEPIAAATAYVYGTDIAHEKVVLIFDLGRTTFDVSLVTIDKNGMPKVKTFSNDSQIGGQHFDTVMVNHFVKIFNEQYKTDISGNIKALAKLRHSCEKGKKSLSLTSEITIKVDSLHQGIDLSTRITRLKFEHLTSYLFNTCIETVEMCLRDAVIDKEDIDEVVLVGMSTKIPKVRQLLREFFDGRVVFHNSMHPSEVIAHGAARVSEKLSHEKSRKTKKFVLPNSVPLSLGVDAHDGTFSVCVPRNTSIPTKKERIYFTTKDDQESIYFNVYQGERSRAKDNNLLGKFEVAVPLAPRGKSKVKVVFKIDEDGILNCSVKELTTSLKKKITIDNEKLWISKAEIEKMLDDAEKYKVIDNKYKKKVFARNALEEYVYNVKRKVYIIGRNDKTILHMEDMKKMETAIENASKYLDLTKLADVDECENMLNQLEKLCVSVITKLL